MRERKRVREIAVPQLVDQGRDNRICLPSFQRDFVWSPKQMAMLIESVIRHYPIGTIMLLDADGNEDLGKHSIVGTDSNACQPNHFVIDGQQRLTTFYKLL